MTMQINFETYLFRPCSAFSLIYKLKHCCCRPKKWAVTPPAPGSNTTEENTTLLLSSNVESVIKENYKQQPRGWAQLAPPEISQGVLLVGQQSMECMATCGDWKAQTVLGIPAEQSELSHTKGLEATEQYMSLNRIYSKKPSKALLRRIQNKRTEYHCSDISSGKY